LIGEGRPTGRVDLSAAASCLLVADALGGDRSQALPLATSLAFMTAMASIFQELEADDVHGGESLETAWGMPRSVNAGDAFFVLAQQSVLRETGLDAETTFAATEVLSAASRALSEDIYAARRNPRRILPHALAMGALAAHAGPAAAQELQAFGELLERAGFDETQRRVETLHVEASAKSKLEELAAYFTRGR
jgi:hypothetical protein